MSHARRLLRLAQRLLPAARGPGLTVLAYHLVEGGTPSAVDLPRDVFRRHLEELAEGAEVVSLEDGLRQVREGVGGARPRVALTFDDAYRNFVEEAWPLLAERAMPATLFVPVGFVEGQCPPPNSAAPLPAASWDELSALVATRELTVGSHTWTHRDLPSLPDDEVRVELVRSRRRLEERLRTTVDSFCYPRGLWSPRVERRVGEVYRVATIGGGGRTRPGRLDPLRVQRISLRRDGPPSLAPLLKARVWLEERVADRLRRWRG